MQDVYFVLFFSRCGSFTPVFQTDRWSFRFLLPPLLFLYSTFHTVPHVSLQFFHLLFLNIISSSQRLFFSSTSLPFFVAFCSPPSKKALRLLKWHSGSCLSPETDHLCKDPSSFVKDVKWRGVRHQGRQVWVSQSDSVMRCCQGFIHVSVHQLNASVMWVKTVLSSCWCSTLKCFQKETRHIIYQTYKDGWSAGTILM